LAPRIAGFGIEAGEQFVGEGDTDHLFCLSGLGQRAVEGDEVEVVSADDFDDGEEDCADRGAAAAYGARAMGLAAVARQRSEAGQLADGFVREGADLGHFGHHPRDGTPGHALDLAERPVEAPPQRVGGNELGDLRFEGAALPGDQREQFVERLPYDRLGDQAALVQRGDAQLGQLAQAGDERGQTLLGGRGRQVRHDPLDRGESGDDPGVDPVGLLQEPHRLGKAAHRARVDDGHRHAIGPQQAKGQPLVPAGCLHRHQACVVLPAERRQRRDPLGHLLEAARRSSAADPGIELVGRGIHSTDKGPSR
jgi:hypothetical protein